MVVWFGLVSVGQIGVYACIDWYVVDSLKSKVRLEKKRNKLISKHQVNEKKTDPSVSGKQKECTSNERDVLIDMRIICIAQNEQTNITINRMHFFVSSMSYFIWENI